MAEALKTMNAASMSIYEKINAVRLDYQHMNVRKSGINKFAKYEYYQLSDILPHINRLCSEYGLFCKVDFVPELASLSIIDIDKPEVQPLVFTSPMGAAALSGCHDVQNLGAVETYIKRYLYQNAFEIVESDALDMATDTTQKNSKQDGVQSDRPQKLPENPKSGEVVSIKRENKDLNAFFHGIEGYQKIIGMDGASLAEKVKEWHKDGYLSSSESVKFTDADKSYVTEMLANMAAAVIGEEKSPFEE